MAHRVFRNTVGVRVRDIPPLFEGTLAHAALHVFAQSAVLAADHICGPRAAQLVALGHARVCRRIGNQGESAPLGPVRRDRIKARGVKALRADGSSKRAFAKDKLDAGEALLVYKIGGEYLDATRGYPCTNWVEGVDAQINSKHWQIHLVSWYHKGNLPLNEAFAVITG